MKNLILALFALQTSIAFAQWTKIPASEYDLPSPPQVGSADYARDFEILLVYQDTRSKDECKLAASQEFPSFQVMYGPSAIFSQDEIKKYQGFVTRVGGYGAKIADKFKEEFRRKRPYDADKRVHPCIKKPGGSKSYPSGHATLGATTACALAMILPDRAQKIIEWGNYLGELRVIAGVHHPSDVAASRDLSAQICNRLAQEPDFQKEIQALQ